MVSRLGRLLVLAACGTTVLAACGTTVPQRTVIAGRASVGFGDTAAIGADGSDAGQVSGDGTAPAANAAAVPGANTPPAAGAPGAPAGIPSSAAPGAVTTSAGPVKAVAGASRGTLPTSRTADPTSVKAGASVKPSARSSVTATQAATGAAAGSGPINVGIAYTNNSATTSQLGGQMNTTINQENAAKALVAGMNKSGGVDGRMINASYYGFNTSGNSYSTDATAACQQFTQDNHESVVLDEAFGTTGGFDSCIAKAGVLDIDAAEESDAATSSQAVLHENSTTMNVDRLYAAVLGDLARSGYLTKSNQVGVIIEDCPENKAAYMNTLAPLIAKLGLEAPVQSHIDCTAGFQAAGTAATAISNDVLTFRTRGVDRVFFVSLQEATVTLLFATSASSQQYRPGYMLSSNSAVGAELASLPSDQQPQVNGAGYEPFSDVVNPPAPSAVEKRCIAYAQAGGVNPASTSDFDLIFFACAPLLLLEAGMKAAAASSDPRVLTNAINGLGNSFASPGVLNNSTTFGPARHDGPNTAQVFGYVPSCTCIHYSGSPIPAP